MNPAIYRIVGILLVVAPIGCGPAPGEGDLVRVAPGVAYTLEDGERYHRDAPDTFEIPPRAAREALAPGRIVKLMFRITAGDETMVERMWVVVESGDARGFVGSLDNQPRTTPAMRPGMTVHFRPEHVINIYPIRDDGAPEAPDRDPE